MASLGLHKAKYDMEAVVVAIQWSMPMIKAHLSKLPNPVVPMMVTSSWPNDVNGAVMLYQYMLERATGNPELVKRYREALVNSKHEWLLDA